MELPSVEKCHKHLDAVFDHTEDAKDKYLLLHKTASACLKSIFPILTWKEAEATAENWFNLEGKQFGKGPTKWDERKE
jgi:hypothetical protein